MGGMVTIAARYKNNEVVKFKTNTNFFHYNMNSPHLLNEENFKERVIKENFLRDDHLPEDDAEEYDCRKGMLAPYDYGIILIDYVNNTLLSANNYSPMIYASSAKLLAEYGKFVNQNFILKVGNFGSDEYESFDIKETRFMEFAEVHFIHMALKHGAKIFLKGNEVKHDGTLISVVENIYGVTLHDKDAKSQRQFIRDYEDEQYRIEEEKNGQGYSLANYSDISFEYPGFTFIEGDGAEDCGIIYEYIKNNGFTLTEAEEARWKSYIERMSKQDDEE
jgi:hypothetical protein